MASRTFSEEHKQKLRDARRRGIAEGRITVWNKGQRYNLSHSKQFKVGHTPWNKGKKTGIVPSTVFQAGTPAWNRDIPLSEDQRAKISAAKTGKPSSLKGKPRYDLRGSNNPSWKGGLRGIDYRERRRFRHLMQKQVFERDDYTCQLCGERGGDLQVDHIQSWAEYVELRFSLENCRTVCKPCHYEITFGRPMKDKSMPWGHNLGRKETL